MNILLETYHRLLSESGPSYQRRFYDYFTMPQRIVGIVGGRGVGKTTFLLEYLRRTYARSSQGLYVSADHLYFNEHTLLSLADRFVKEYDGRLLCIDEIHRYARWNQELKNITDSYPRLRVIFSGSSSIDLVKGKYDLSRRAFLVTMAGFSFREFIESRQKRSVPVMDIKELLTGKIGQEAGLMDIPRLLGLLKEYLQYGYYPASMAISDRNAFQQSLLAIIDKTIFEDMSSFYSLRTGNLNTIKKLIFFFATAQPGSININRLAQSLGKDHTTIAGYVQMLRDSGLLRFLLIDKKGHALIRNAEKIYVDNPNILYAINDTIGKETNVGMVREVFVASALQNAGVPICYTKHGDIEVSGYTLEIGGRSKGERFDKNIPKRFIVADDTLIVQPGVIPMYLFGFLH